jgi:hypothetical protein
MNTKQLPIIETCNGRIAACALGFDNTAMVADCARRFLTTGDRKVLPES